MRWSTHGFTLGLVGGALGVALACNNIAFTDEPCSAGTDCLAPYVCCTKPRIPAFDKSIPYCERRDICDDYLPFLVDGNPCGRRPSAKGGDGGLDTRCAEGFECCSNTLTCKKNGSCPTQPPAPGPDGGTGGPCSADDECSPGEICCEISFFNRDGKCTTVQGCGGAKAPTQVTCLSPPGDTIAGPCCTISEAWCRKDQECGLPAPPDCTIAKLEPSACCGSRCLDGLGGLPQGTNVFACVAEIQKQSCADRAMKAVPPSCAAILR